jgi:hypothetical protein
LFAIRFDCALKSHFPCAGQCVLRAFLFVALIFFCFLCSTALHTVSRLTRTPGIFRALTVNQYDRRQVKASLQNDARHFTRIRNRPERTLRSSAATAMRPINA